jgi:putative inorganic carbon (HCO3(-)) transporter
VIAIAALSGPAPKAGVIVLALLVGAAILMPAGPPDRRRAGAMLGALVLAPVLLLADIWHSPQLGVVHSHPLVAALGALVGLSVACGLAVVIARRPPLLALLVLLALPFRVPIQTGVTTVNLLVPLYLVVGAGVLAVAVPGLRGRPAASAGPKSRAVTWMERMLVLYVLLYAIQSVYSPDFEKALQQMVFFYVPFGLMYSPLRELEWSRELLARCLILVVALGLVFACVGFVEYATKTLFLNPKLVAANNVHTYFTVNSVFFDPDIFGRYLALVMILLASVVLYSGERREQLGAVGALAVLWAGLVLTLSRSSLGALLVGLGILGAMRWRARPILIGGAVVIAIGVAALAISPKTFGLNQGANGYTSGRAGLASGGLHLFAEKPLWGNGSGSFETRYAALHKNTAITLTASHTIAITIAAEQGLVGELPYAALVVLAAVAMLGGARRDPRRAAVAAAFIALVGHTELYADFLEDPATWVLLAVGGALAYSSRVKPSSATPARGVTLSAS